MLNLHQFTDSNGQLKVHYCKSNNITRSYQRRCRGDWKTMAGRLLQQVSFELFSEGGSIMVHCVHH